MPSPFTAADDAALLAYCRAEGNGVAHAMALRIAVSVWFARCPWADAVFGKQRVTGLIVARPARIC